MLRARFQDHRTSGSGEDPLRVLPLYGRGGNLGHATLTIYLNFRSPFPERLYMKLALIGQAVQRRRCLKIMVIYMYKAPGLGQTTQRVKGFH